MASQRPLFLLGAGFNCDATSELGLKEAVSIDSSRVSADYPLVAGLLDCFGLREFPAGQSVEHLFQEAIQSRNQKPIEKLFLKLRYCDYEIPRKLVGTHAVKPNAYSSFFEQFPDSDFLTFNYDGLVEIALLALRRWIPSDGYGVEVDIDLPPYASPPATKSSNLVIHLHGSLYVRWDKFPRPPNRPDEPAMIERLNEPRFWFDPDAAANAFSPFGRATVTGDYGHPERIMPPVLDKTTIAASPFDEAARQIALELARAADPLVVIGYSFNPHDRDSYDPILQATNGRILIVAPDGAKSRDRLISDYPDLNIDYVPIGFAKWVRSGYCGMNWT